MKGRPNAAACVVCRARGALEPIVLDARARLCCAHHATIARAAGVTTVAALRKLAEPARDRRRADRRVEKIDRRAFWRPTPDRRREGSEDGRRATDR